MYTSVPFIKEVHPWEVYGAGGRFRTTFGPALVEPGRFGGTRHWELGLHWPGWMEWSRACRVRGTACRGARRRLL